MTIQTLVSTMNQSDHSLLSKMNIQTDAIIVNQCDRNEIERFSYNGYDILWISLNEQGVGLSRNTALMRATADIILFADEDVSYYDGYPEMIQKAFIENNKADFLLVDLLAIGDVKKTREPYTLHRVHWYNSMHYGAVHFACKRGMLFKNGLFFNLLFGGGTIHSCGEDTIFLANSLKAGLNVWTVPGYIGTVSHGKSTWFCGYTDKYFYDKGILLRTIYGKKAYLLIVFLFLKNSSQTKEYGFIRAVKKAYEGASEKSDGNENGR